jgi:predicted Rossmann fold nucleotide-binding protein DprA/Smf involved in DNA uptake
VEYQTLTPSDQDYPKRLLDRLGESSPKQIFYWGPLDFLKRFTMAVISADSISGLALMATNQLLFTIREYDLNIVGGWHSVMETEIFRLGLFRKNIKVTLFTAKGLERETFESFLETRFYPPLHEFPERDEYFRRAKEGKLLMLSASPPEEAKMKRPNIINRNWLACILSDVVFVPFAEKGTKTLSLAKQVLSAKIPIFTTDHEENKSLHQLGIPGLSRKSVGAYLEKLGAHRAQLSEGENNKIILPKPTPETENKSPKFLQEKFNF